MLIYEIDDKMYEQDITLICECDINEMLNIVSLKHNAETVLMDHQDGKFFSCKGSWYIFLSEFDWSIAHQGLLHHEIGEQFVDRHLLLDRHAFL